MFLYKGTLGLSQPAATTDTWLVCLQCSAGWPKFPAIRLTTPLALLMPRRTVGLVRPKMQGVG